MTSRCTKCETPLAGLPSVCPLCGGPVIGPVDNLITLSELQRAQKRQKESAGRLGFNYTELGYIEESELTAFLSKQYGVPSIHLSDFEIDPSIIALVPREVAEKHRVIPVNRAGATVIVAMADPSNIFAIDDLRMITGFNIEVVVASDESIAAAIEQYYGKGPTPPDGSKG